MPIPSSQDPFATEEPPVPVTLAGAGAESPYGLETLNLEEQYQNMLAGLEAQIVEAGIPTNYSEEAAQQQIDIAAQAYEQLQQMIANLLGGSLHSLDLSAPQDRTALLALTEAERQNVYALVEQMQYYYNQRRGWESLVSKLAFEREGGFEHYLDVTFGAAGYRPSWYDQTGTAAPGGVPIPDWMIEMGLVPQEGLHQYQGQWWGDPQMVKTPSGQTLSQLTPSQLEGLGGMVEWGAGKVPGAAASYSDWLNRAQSMMSRSLAPTRWATPRFE